MTTDLADPPSWDWADQPVEPGPTIIFDIDGVISDASERQHFLDGPNKRWREFFAACVDDSLIVENATLGWSLAPELIVVLLTARPGWVRRLTLEWLDRQPVRWDLLIMRTGDDHDNAKSFKRRSVEELRERGFDLRLAIEDERGNVDMFRAAGIPTIYHHSGYYD